MDYDDLKERRLEEFLEAYLETSKKEIEDARKANERKTLPTTTLRKSGRTWEDLVEEGRRSATDVVRSNFLLYLTAFNSLVGKNVQTYVTRPDDTPPVILTQTGLRVFADFPYVVHNQLTVTTMDLESGVRVTNVRAFVNDVRGHDPIPWNTKGHILKDDRQRLIGIYIREEKLDAADRNTECTRLIHSTSYSYTLAKILEFLRII